MRVFLRNRGLALTESLIILIILALLVAFVVPNLFIMHAESGKNTCIDNLRRIEEAKDEWALEKRKKAGDPVVKSEVDELIEGGVPICPSGGKYNYGAVGVKPACSSSSKGHELP